MDLFRFSVLAYQFPKFLFLRNLSFYQGYLICWHTFSYSLLILVAMSPVFLLISVNWLFSLFFLVILAKSFVNLLIFFKNQLLASLIFLYVLFSWELGDQNLKIATKGFLSSSVG